MTLPKLFLFGSIAAVQIAACPWCTNSPLQKPTVTLEMGDPGGKFFGKSPPLERTRRFFIAAEPVTWDFAPGRIDPVTQRPIPPRLQNPPSLKMRYFQYTDETFSVRATDAAHLGILGPVLRGTTGDFLAVTFLNRTDRPLSIHPHGVKYDKDSEGSSYFPERGLGAAIAPQARFTYVWQLDAAAGPAPHEPSSKAWLYHSHVLADQEINLGLMGFIVVTDPARARPDGTPADVDRELATAFMIFNEGFSEGEDLSDLPLPADPAAKTNFLNHRLAETITEMQRAELDARHSINGRIFGNLNGLEMNEGERVRWYLFALGSERDLHTAHWHGTRVTWQNRSTDVVELLPGSMAVTDFIADNPGNWLFHCHIADHMMEGMYAPFVVHGRESTNALSKAREHSLYSVQLPPETLRIENVVLEKSGGAEFLRLTALFHLTNPLLLEDMPVHLDLGNRRWSFRLHNGKAASGDGASLQIERHKTGGGLGVEMKVVLLVPHDGAPLDSRKIPLRLHLDKTLLAGTVWSAHK